LSFAARATAAIDTVCPAQAQAVTSHLRILAVDDDPLMSKSLRDTLEADGHLVVTAKRGAGGHRSVSRCETKE
jgi:CheY-like chemotaxis protein